MTYLFINDKFEMICFCQMLLIKSSCFPHFPCAGLVPLMFTILELPTFIVFRRLLWLGCNEDIQTLSEMKNHKKQNRFVPLSEGVSHPFNSTIVVRTKVCGFVASALIIFLPR
ncbi:hypothetical protein CICLE_v10018194mg [Citrus x clementina]|uniref:Uncharacterized protein n=1 Tax=Citrus clementina TaxID=85681 RepID=V4U5A8_CITCL|nr:hypothetical protein CICLE_v10018194mg [Citrus x clementina]